MITLVNSMRVNDGRGVPSFFLRFISYLTPSLLATLFGWTNLLEVSVGKDTEAFFSLNAFTTGNPIWGQNYLKLV